jgi:uncharacterized metal-binding protein
MKREEDDASTKRVIFTCSGAAHVGHVADVAARQLARDDRGRMLCVAAVGAGEEAIIRDARDADEVLVIDGCDKDCARKTLARAQITDVCHIRVSDLDVAERDAPPSPVEVKKVMEGAG